MLSALGNGIFSEPRTVDGRTSTLKLLAGPPAFTPPRVLGEIRFDVGERVELSMVFDQGDSIRQFPGGRHTDSGDIVEVSVNCVFGRRKVAIVDYDIHPPAGQDPPGC
ncbi:hypothetical protein [Lignipirellula cremea]|uniref:Uncharacterized protein n=1 Tax=Lignipirellula cremea TaxID=2528010 RepID=A0A518DSY9_9BACT|nr:hypothetical protein [Lignipirellula cremea]QDU94949.1 hypothetical protein Pla8534_27570 [Lignipirellula cremea]